MRRHPAKHAATGHRRDATGASDAIIDTRQWRSLFSRGPRDRLAWIAAWLGPDRRAEAITQASNFQKRLEARSKVRLMNIDETGT